jgi:hypothetical protein
MKPSPHSPADARKPAPHQDRLAAIRRKARIAEAKRRKNRLTMWRAVLIAGFALAAIFICLEALKPAPPEKKPLIAEIVAVPSAPPAPKRASAEALPETPPTPAIPEAPEPAAIVRAPEETAAPVTSDSARIAAEPELLLTGMDAGRETAIRRDQDLLKRAITGKEWDAYRGLLARSIRASLETVPQGRGVNRFDPVWNQPALYQALLRWRTLGWFSESQIAPLVIDEYTGGFIAWLLNRNEAMEELLLTIRSSDDGGKVLKFLMDAWSLNEEHYQKYYPLALACAVVFDETMTIPHPVGAAEYGAESTVDPLKRYLWYIEKNEKGKLVAPVHRSSARDLIWVVCAPVSTSELDWAIGKMHLSRKHWGNAYEEVEYLMERAVEGLNPYKEYSFAEILKEGGICDDRAYFCVNTARAQGIPAMTISGETDLGGHAWVGIKIDANEWDTSTGRIAGSAKGEARNPQTRGSITEQEIQLWNDRHHQSPVVTLSVFRHLWLADFFIATENTEGKGTAIRLANQLGHSFPETWMALYTLLEEQTQLTGEPPEPANLEDWKNFAKNMRQEFKDNPRMAELAANAELEYVFPYGTEGDARRTLLRERRRIERESGEQKDLIAASLKREAELLVRRGGPNVKRDIARLYDRALRDYGGSITGFKTMAEDYFSYFRNDPELARKAARDIELAFKRVVETGTKDWFRANTESSIYRMICGYYRQAGDPDRAEMLEKRYEVLLKRARRSAL